MDKKLNFKLEAVERAISIYEEIRDACTKPDKMISGETLDIYKYLEDWGFFEKYLISDISNKWLYVTVLAMHFTTKNQIEFPARDEQKGKWQIIQAALERSSRGNPSKKKA